MRMVLHMNLTLKKLEEPAVKVTRMIKSFDTLTAFSSGYDAEQVI